MLELGLQLLALGLVLLFAGLWLRRFGALVILAITFAALGLPPSGADEQGDCEGSGRLAFALTQIGQECDGYRLTEAGRTVQRKMFSRVAEIGIDRCAVMGKQSLTQSLAFLSPDLDAAARSGDQRRFTRAWCAAIASYLDMLGGPKTYERR